jgi:phosphoenolpyruvate-protein kinase (PTS system EI component)
MAGEPFHTPLLIGCGLRVLSMNPVSVPAVKNVVRRCRADACLALVQELLTLPTAGDIVARLRAFHAEHLADA